MKHGTQTSGSDSESAELKRPLADLAVRSRRNRSIQV